MPKANIDHMTIDEKEVTAMKVESRYFVCGGEYATHGGEFRLVTPGGGIPYVWDSPHKNTFTEHHSHLYELSSDRKSVNLIKQSRYIFTGEDLEGCGAPKHAKLNEDDYIGVIERIKQGDIY